MENRENKKKTPYKMARVAWPKAKYGVVFAVDQTKVNWDETEKLRASQTRPAEMFHRGCYYNAEADRIADLN